MMHFLNKLEETLLALLLVSMTLVTFSQVVARSVFNSGATWALELTQYLFAWLVLLGMSYGVRVNAHIGVDAFVRLFPAVWQRFFGVLTALLGILYCILFFIGASRYVYTIYGLNIHSEDLPIPQWIPYLILPVGLALLALRLIYVVYKIVVGTQTNLLADEVHDILQEHSERTP